MSKAMSPAPRAGGGKAPARLTGGTRKSSTKPPRSRAREFVLQGLYQHLVGGNDAASIDAFTRDLQGFAKADSAHYDAALHGCIELAGDLDALIVPLLDRPLAEISPVERACMWIGAYEFLHCPDIPWRVVLNESIELAKDFGGTDGHKYVNGVLNGLAAQLRKIEVEADRRQMPPREKKAKAQ
ncbi:MAG: transcription antitermination factor NusB [Burkholderiaceae bacterium]|jgi:N utilization substance protein B|nr:transcription antitermination factor NusB [Burkholderiaceae bacterium]